MKVRGGVIGTFNGTATLMSSKKDYFQNMRKYPNAAYVIFDDGMALVYEDRIIGWVQDENGSVKNCKEVIKYSDYLRALKMKNSIQKLENEMKNEKEMNLDEILKSVFDPLELEEISLEGLGEI